MRKQTTAWILTITLCLLLLASCDKAGSSSEHVRGEGTLPETTEEGSKEETQPTEESKETLTVAAVYTESETSEEETSETAENETKETEKEEDIIYSLSDKVNVRAYPDLSGAIEGQVNAGDELVRTAVLESGWSEVIFQGRTCYVYTELFAKKQKERETIPVDEPGIHEGTGIYYGNNRGPLVAIDAGHQRHGDSSLEPNAPGSDVMKAKVTSGTQGVSTGVPEYVLNLAVSLKLRDALLAQGYRVLMIRETHDVVISNAERATLANEYGADIFLRVHANGSDDPSVSGSLTMAASASNPYVGHLAGSSQYLCRLITDAICRKTGFVNRGLQLTDTMTGINWCQMPVAIIEMGFMTNTYEDEAMQQDYVQDEIVAGIVEAVNTYFG